MSGSCSSWFATVFFWLMLTNFAGFILAPNTLTAALAKDEIAVTQKRTGKVADSSLLSKRPPSGIISDQTSWQSLWSAWRAGQEIPKVDFQNQVVLVATANGPNVVLTSTLNLTPSGDLRYESASTKMAGPGFGYALLIIPRKGIISVNGQKLVGQKLGGQKIGQQLGSQLPSGQPATTPSTMAPTELQPAASASINSSSEESIRVEIQGKVRTGILSRAASTGTMVVANGIVWELDLGNDAQLIEAVNQLGTDVGTIKGTLSKLTNPDRSVRWIVDVASIEPALPGNKNPGSSGGLAQSEPAVAKELSMDKGKAMPEMGERNMQMTKPAAEMTSKMPVPGQTGFETIVVSATGGRSSLERKQTVAANGSVTLEIPETNYSESFSLEAGTLSELHQFVASADWRSVPRITSPTDKDATNFSITVETKSGTKRFFANGASISSQPVISKLFSLMQKPKKDQ